MEFKEKVAEAIESGVEPIRLEKYNVKGCDSRTTYGFYSVLKVNSTQLGTLTEEQFGVTAEKSGLSVPLTDRALAYAAKGIDRMASHSSPVKWLSVPCPVSYFRLPNLTERLKKFIEDDKKREFLCLAVPSEILNEEPEEIKKITFNLRLQGVRTVLTGFGGAFCPTLRLLEFDFDRVLLDKSLAPLMRNPERQKSAEAIARFAKSGRSEVIVFGTESADEVAAWYKGDCDGYIESGEPEALPLPEEEAVTE